MSGCSDCKHVFVTMEGAQCDRHPWKFETVLQQSIAAWLAERYKYGDDSWTAPGCPGFEQEQRIV